MDGQTLPPETSIGWPNKSTIQNIKKRELNVLLQKAIKKMLLAKRY